MDDEILSRTFCIEVSQFPGVDDDWIEERAAAIGHAILGDPLYASEAVQARAPRLMLHAESLALAHPASGEPCKWSAPLPF